MRALALVALLALSGCCFTAGNVQFCGFRHIDLELKTDHDDPNAPQNHP